MIALLSYSKYPKIGREFAGCEQQIYVQEDEQKLVTCPRELPTLLNGPDLDSLVCVMKWRCTTPKATVSFHSSV